MKAIIFVALLLSSTILFSQVGVNTTSPDPSAMLDVSATDKGLLVPRISLTNINTSSLDGVNTAANSLLIYNTNAGVVGGDGVGFYWFNGTQWNKLVTSNSSAPTSVWDKSGTLLTPGTDGDDIQLSTNEHIELTNTTTAPDVFVEMYQSNIGTNVRRDLFSETASPNSASFDFDPQADAFIVNAGGIDRITLDTNDPNPLTVLGGMTLGNGGNTYTLPNNNGNAGEFLQTDGTGTADWTTWEDANIGFWDEVSTGLLAPRTAGDDVRFNTNEHIELTNTTTTPDVFVEMYQSNIGTNVRRDLFSETASPNSASFDFDPQADAFIVNAGGIDRITLDTNDPNPLTVLGGMTLGNGGNTYTLPNNNGNAGEFLQTDGTGTADWTTWEDANIGFWDEVSTGLLAPRTAGDDVRFNTNEHIELTNTTTTPDVFVEMYQSNIGTNVRRDLFSETASPNSASFDFDPQADAFIVNAGGIDRITLDTNDPNPLTVLGGMTLGNGGNTYTLPNNNGNAGEFLQTDGTGTADWTTWEDANIGFWDEVSTGLLAPRTAGDDVRFNTNEHIELTNTTTTPDVFVEMYQSNIGTNVRRDLFSETASPNSASFDFDPQADAFIVNAGGIDRITLDTNDPNPLTVLGGMTLGNGGNTYTLPNNNGNAGEFLQTDGTGTADWTTWEDANIGFWDEVSTGLLAPRTAGDDVRFNTNEHIELTNTTTTPDVFVEMYQSNIGTNVRRDLFSETASPNSASFDFDPQADAFIVNAGGIDRITLDTNDPNPLTVLGGMTLGNGGNTYTLPSNNGNSGEFLQTDGTGIASWVDASSVLMDDVDFLEIGTGISPDAITDNIYTQGRMAIGRTAITNVNNVLEAAKNGSSFISVRSDDGSGVSGYRFDRGGSGQNYGIVSSSSGPLDVLSFSRDNSGFTGGAVDMTIDENGEFTFAAIISQPTNRVSIGQTASSTSTSDKVTIRGMGSSSSTNALRIKNASNITIAQFKDDGSLTIGSASGVDYTFPSVRGSANQILQTDGSGNVNWQNAPENFWARTSGQLDVATAGDDINFSSDQTSIIFPETTGTPSTMIHLFESGFTNSDRMVLSQSPSFSNWGLMYRDTDDSFRFVTAGADRVVVNLGGGNPLVVNGIAQATVFQSATTTYPDYVFEDYYKGSSNINSEYSFKTLVEMESFIKENGHLPGVKSYKEISEEGMQINLAETSIANLEKIEELFLYTIELKKENETLKQHQKQLENRLKSLEQLINKK